MTNLQVVIDPAVGSDPGDIGRYTTELTSELIRSAPDEVGVEALVASVTAQEYEQLNEELPGLLDVRKSAFDRGTLRSMWRRGLGGPTRGLIHATDVFAPLRKRSRGDDDTSQVVVTVPDARAWTEPDLLPKGEASARRSMLKRAERYADALIVPSHTVADQLSNFGRFGDRVRVIPPGATAWTVPPADAASRAERLGLPNRFVFVDEEAAGRNGLATLVKAMSRTDGPTVPLVVNRRGDLNDVIKRAGLDSTRVVQLDRPTPEDLATVLSRATVYVQPSPVTGFGLRALDALAAGVPVVHCDDAALEELTADAALVIDRKDVSGYTASLAQHLEALLDDEQTLARLRIAGQDRARWFSWRDAAEKVWQLHADL
ncbi:glycosyltransferase family 4 protein [Arenivirga flava]|uniref:Glycosyl transferase n=1 Tax=Arenivirga flava TaxID=1930060 RepID=A0AA37XC03_9MICO|nr:glycosyltransferase family 1 protein [Arenivirga flava]GMA28022.1 glycosyl transferase [Arenivirga flava]